MSTTIDVNILVYAADDLCPRHSRSRALLNHLATSSSIVYLFWPALLGYMRIITHPGILHTPLSPDAAMADIEDLMARPQVRVVGEGARFWPSFQRVAATSKPRGKLVPDAHLVALMHEHGVSRIWTNDRDFRKFDGITSSNPFDDRYSDGFS